MTRHFAYRFVATLGIILLSCVKGEAQEWTYQIEDLGFFDNREVHSPYQRSQTLFGTRLGAETGLKRDSSSVMAGYYLIQEFGRGGLADHGWTLYYRYEGTRFSGAFGSFPRRLLQRELPDVFEDDSLRYYVPNRYGALLQYYGTSGSAELYCNWRGRQSYTEREIFEIVSDGEWFVPVDRQRLVVGYNAELTHFSVRRGKTTDKVYDKVMLNPYLGFKAECGGILLDSAFVQAGLLVSFNRDRMDKIWKTPCGLLADMHLHKGLWGIRNRLYVGGCQLNDYEKYGRALHQGDTYYRSGFYDRLDASVRLLHKEHVDCSVLASFHFTEGTMDSSQLIRLNIIL